MRIGTRRTTDVLGRLSSLTPSGTTRAKPLHAFAAAMTGRRRTQDSFTKPCLRRRVNTGEGMLIARRQVMRFTVRTVRCVRTRVANASARRVGT